MTMVKVRFTSSFHAAFGGTEALTIEASTLRELMRILLDTYPRLQKHLEGGIALAINGQIYRDNLDVVIPEGAEVFMMPRIQGG